MTKNTKTIEPKVRKPRAAKKITAAEATALLDHAAETGTVDLPTAVVETKRRKVSGKERDDTGKVLRKGRNLSGNQPFRRKPYWYDLDAKDAPGYAVAFEKAPMQVRLILKYMEDQGITTPDDAEVGGDICGGAINSGALKSKIDPAALFAYYRRVMEQLGLRLAIAE
jgi:hypothetical protein